MGFLAATLLARKKSKNAPTASGEPYLRMLQPHATNCHPFPQAQVSTSLMCNNRTFQLLLTLMQQLATVNKSRALKSSPPRCTKLEREARRQTPPCLLDKTVVQLVGPATCRSSTTTSRVTSRSEHAPPAEAHNAILLMSKSNSLGFLHPQINQDRSSRVPFGNSFTLLIRR